MSDAKITVAGGKALQNMAKQLRELGEGKAREAASRAINRGGDMGRTQMTRALVQTTGIQYQKVKSVTSVRRSTPATLSYTVEGSGDETNVGLFKARQLKKGAAASPWKKRRMFPGTFIIQKFGGRVYARRTGQRFPIKPIWGPNVAREMRQGEPLKAWEQTTLNVVERRMLHELDRMLR